MSRDLHPAVLKEKTYQPEKWSNFHRYIVLLEVAGKRPGQIADIVGVSNARVSVILNDARADLDRVQLGGAIADRMTDITSKLEMYAHESLDIIMEEMREVNNKPELRSKNAFGILAAAGYGAVNKHQVEQPPELPKEMADAMISVAQELKEHEFTYKFVEPEMSEEETEF